MELKRRQFLAWLGLGALSSLNLGCGGRGFSIGTLLEPPAQGEASAPPGPSDFIMRNDLGASPRLDAATGTPQRLLNFGHLSDVHITLEQFTFTGHPKLEKMLDGFGEEIGFGGLDRPDVQEKYDVDTLRAMVKTLNAADPPLDFVINTGDAVDIGTVPELVGFLSEMNQLNCPWFQAVGNHDCLGLGNIPPEMLENFTDLDFLNKQEFIEKHFPQEAHSLSRTAFGSQAKGFDFSPASHGNPPEFLGYYAFTAMPPVSGGDGRHTRPGIRLYVLETSRAAGKALGHVGKEQLRWLKEELGHHPRFLGVVVSHHPIGRIEEGREELRNLLLDHPQVIALVCGHEHRHRIQAFKNTQKPGTGFWQIQTGSLIDYPQQGRILEIYDRGNGTGAIRTFVFNQQANGQLGKNARASFRSAAGERFDGSGSSEDRNVELIFPMPLLF
ncbi:Ser/Thr phosphatase family protein [delta proteobacterium NaphS2]|nr:Ser/Thr phosphatase family protein [delta proteobacterium NaphS2]